MLQADSAGDQAKPKRPCNWLRTKLAQHFPDTLSRVAFIVALLGAVVISLLWLIWTIQNRWIFAIDHPVQSISYESVASIPALVGVQFSFLSEFLPPDLVHYLRVVPVSDPEGASGNNPSLIPAVNCNLTTFAFEMALCQQVWPDTGLPFFNAAIAPPGEMDGSSASKIDLSAMPLQFTHSAMASSAVCFQVHMLANQTALDASARALPPVFLMGILSPSSLLAQNELTRAGHTAASDPLVQAWSARDSAVQVLGFLQFARSLIMEFTATNTIDVDGSVSVGYRFQTLADLPRGPGQQVRDFKSLLQFTPDRAEQLRLAKLYADPSTVYQSTHLCMAPQTLTVEVVRKQVLYGWSQFLSDAGGALNILTLALAMLFPLTFKAVKSKTFLPLWIALKWKRRHEPTAPLAPSVSGTELQDKMAQL